MFPNSAEGGNRKSGKFRVQAAMAFTRRRFWCYDFRQSTPPRFKLLERYKNRIPAPAVLPKGNL